MLIKSLVISKRCFGMKFWQYVVLAAFMFVCMYDPKSGGLERYVTPQRPRDASVSSGCCDPPIGRTCSPQHFQSVQFAQPSQGCPIATPRTQEGAIIGR